MKKRIAVSVSNDLITDQRVRKQCDSLHSAGCELLLLGRLLPGTTAIERPYRVERFSMLFRRKAFFYAELNIRLFFRLLFARFDLLYANDLDTLPANALLSLLRRKPLVYDSHEFFTEVPEIQGRAWVKAIWKLLERTCIARARLVITVNASIARLLRERYGLSEVLVVRNVPDMVPEFQQGPDRSELDLPEGKKILLVQGSGINVDRGVEELISAMAYLSDVLLLIIGRGDALPGLKRQVDEMGIGDRVRFIDRMPYRQMMAYTACADLGLSLDKPSNINYRYSLPNKVFDYIAAGIPVMVSDLVELRRLVEESGVGVIASSHDPQVLAQEIGDVLADEAALSRFRQAAGKAASRLSWSVEYAGALASIRGLLKG